MPTALQVDIVNWHHAACPAGPSQRDGLPRIAHLDHPPGCSSLLHPALPAAAVSLEPGFSVSRLCWMLAYNGVYAVANLRGGGEYGIEWRNAGSMQNKQVRGPFRTPDCTSHSGQTAWLTVRLPASSAAQASHCCPPLCPPLNRVCLYLQNVFDDFQSCAEFLHSAGYSSPGSLAIQGGSNGGLLVAACANQRPDLFQASRGWPAADDQGQADELWSSC